MSKFHQEIKASNLIDLRNCVDDVLVQYLDYAKNNFQSLKPAEIFTYFKLLLAKRGRKHALATLELSRHLIDKLDFISLASYITLNSGDYVNQLMYLNEIEQPAGWVAREKVRCLLSCGEFQVALTMIDELMQINPDFYRSFVSNIAYQLNDYRRGLDYSVPGSIEYQCAKLGLVNNVISKPIISSLYTHYSVSQLTIQKFSSQNSGYCIDGCLGVTPDRFSSSILKNLTDRIDNIGILGASLGHIKMIEEFLASSKDVLLATESDAFVSYPLLDRALECFESSRFDFVLCSDRHVSSNALADGISINNYNYPGRASGFDGYILNRNAAELILNQFENGKFNYHIDGQIIKWSYLNELINMGVTNFPLFSQSFTSVFSVRTLLELNY